MVEMVGGSVGDRQPRRAVRLRRERQQPRRDHHHPGTHTQTPKPTSTPAPTPSPTPTKLGPTATPTLAPAACLPSSSTSVLISGTDATSYVPEGRPGAASTGIEVVPIETKTGI